MCKYRGEYSGFSDLPPYVEDGFELVGHAGGWAPPRRLFGRRAAAPFFAVLVVLTACLIFGGWAVFRRLERLAHEKLAYSACAIVDHDLSYRESLLAFGRISAADAFFPGVVEGVAGEARYLGSGKLINKLRGEFQNDDIIGFLEIPGGTAKTPIVTGGDGEFYKNHGLDGKKNSAGAVFIVGERELSGRDGVLYGSGAPGGDFEKLPLYADEEYLLSHRYFMTKSGSGDQFWKIFAVTENGETLWRDSGEAIQDGGEGSAQGAVLSLAALDKGTETRISARPIARVDY